MDAVFEQTRGVQEKSILGPFDFSSFFRIFQDFLVGLILLHLLLRTKEVPLVNVATSANMSSNQEMLKK